MVWPTQQQLVTYFFVVMVFVVFMMALVSGLDLVLRQGGLQAVLRRLHELSRDAGHATQQDSE